MAKGNESGLTVTMNIDDLVRVKALKNAFKTGGCSDGIQGTPEVQVSSATFWYVTL